MGLGGYEDKFPWQLSGGMQQRASICRALVHEPKMLLLDEPFGALDAFTREELWCALRDLHAAQRFNVILVTHDLRESVFLADTVYCMSKSPGRFVVKRDIDLPRPRDLEVTYTPQFTDIVHELRGHIGAMRGKAVRSADDAEMKITKNVERWSPLIVLAAVLLLWQLIVVVFGIAEFIFPSPWQIALQFVEFKAPLIEAAWKTFWVTMLGFALSIVVGVLLGFLIGSSRLAYTSLYPLMVAFNAVPKAAVVPILVVWFGIGLGPGILTAFLISFFPITVNIATGLATLEPELEDVLRVLGARRWDVLIKVGLPRSMPYFYGSLKIAITLGLRRHGAGRDDRRRLRHRLPDADRGQPAAHAAGVCRPGDDRRDGDGHVRAVLVDREAHHRVGAPRLPGRVTRRPTRGAATEFEWTAPRRDATPPLAR